MQDKNILTFPGKAPAKVPEVRLSDEDKVKIALAAESIRAVFNPLTKNALHVSTKSPKGAGLAVGPYNMPIKYSNGVATHMAAQYIDKLRGIRKHTANSVELRCDPLGLAIYVAGVSTIKTGEKATQVRERVRVVVYDFDRVEPTSLIYADDYKQLTNKLLLTLVNTYNRLAKDYNIAGLDTKSIKLTSGHSHFPDILLLASMVDVCNY